MQGFCCDEVKNRVSEELLYSFILTVVVWELCKSVSENWYLVCLCGF